MSLSEIEQKVYYCDHKLKSLSLDPYCGKCFIKTNFGTWLNDEMEPPSIDEVETKMFYSLINQKEEITGFSVNKINVVELPLRGTINGFITVYSISDNSIEIEDKIHVLKKIKTWLEHLNTTLPEKTQKNKNTKRPSPQHIIPDIVTSRIIKLRKNDKDQKTEFPILSVVSRESGTDVELFQSDVPLDLWERWLDDIVFPLSDLGILAFFDASSNIYQVDPSGKISIRNIGIPDYVYSKLLNERDDFPNGLMLDTKKKELPLRRSIHKNIQWLELYKKSLSKISADFKDYNPYTISKIFFKILNNISSVYLFSKSLDTDDQQIRYFSDEKREEVEKTIRELVGVFNDLLKVDKFILPHPLRPSHEHVKKMSEFFERIDDGIRTRTLNDIEKVLREHTAVGFIDSQKLNEDSLEKKKKQIEEEEKKKQVKETPFTIVKTSTGKQAKRITPTVIKPQLQQPTEESTITKKSKTEKNIESKILLGKKNCL